MQVFLGQLFIYYSFTSTKCFLSYSLGNCGFPIDLSFMNLKSPIKNKKIKNLSLNKREREEFVSQSPSGPFFLLFLNLVGLILTVLYMVEKKKEKKKQFYTRFCGVILI